MAKFWHPTVLFGTALVLLIWGGAETKVRNDIAQTAADAQSEITNLSLMFQQDVLRTSYNMDRILKFLRRSYERNGYRADWASLVQEDFTFNAQAAQIAIINSRGMMITSSAMPYPKAPVDLSDREHFKVHRDNTSDVLNVSRPVTGRASGKTSVQFTRRFTHADGTFGGVIVISLDPSQLVSTYQNLQVQPGTGFALLGDDDIIRASSGAFSGLIGRGFAQGTQQSRVETKDRDITMIREWSGDTWRMVASRPVEDTPLTVIVSVADQSTAGWAPRQRYYAGASLGTIVVLLIMWRSARRERRHMRQIFDLAHNDPLTKLPNRRSFQSTIEKLLTSQEQPPFLLHLIDLDNFKAVNDTFGHPTGDQLLCAVATRLRTVLRPTDLVFRLGGDEFALIQSGAASIEAGQTVAQRICRAMAEPFVIGAHRLLIGSSIGIASSGPETPDRVTLMKSADVALYLAKSEGRGTYRFYNAEVNSALARRHQLEGELHEAIETGQLELHYQPKVRLDEGARITGYEALVRWRHPVRGMIPPIEFIQLAEESGLIVPLGEWVLTQACRDLAASKSDATVAVNVSAVQFKRGTVVEATQRALAQSGLHAKQLEIEITESMLMHNHAVTQERFGSRRSVGFHVAVDDFGTGYSSLSYLERYPIDSVKIDRSFVAKLGIAPHAAAIIRAIVALARELDMVPVAEGVETESQADMLQALGCTMAQGYLFGRPEPASVVWPKAASQAA